MLFPPYNGQVHEKSIELEAETHETCQGNLNAGAILLGCTKIRNVISRDRVSSALPGHI